MCSGGSGGSVSVSVPTSWSRCLPGKDIGYATSPVMCLGAVLLS